MRFPNTLFAAVGIGMLFVGATAVAQQSVKPTVPPPTGQQAVPFPSARGLAPFKMAFGGFSNGTEHIVAGTRIFGVCWRGGRAPFTVVLRDAHGSELVKETDLNARYLIKASKPVHFDRQNYTILINDADNHSITGDFAVVADNLLSADSGSERGSKDENKILRRAKWLMTQAPPYNYEAYLSLLPLALGRNPEAGSLISSVCEKTQ